jgi:hypothetical protein
VCCPEGLHLGAAAAVAALALMPLLLRLLVLTRPGHAYVVADLAFDAAASAAVLWHSVPLCCGRLVSIDAAPAAAGCAVGCCLLRHLVPPLPMLKQPVRCCGRLFPAFYCAAGSAEAGSTLALGAATACAAALVSCCGCCRCLASLARG